MLQISNFDKKCDAPTPPAPQRLSREQLFVRKNFPDDKKTRECNFFDKKVYKLKICDKKWVTFNFAFHAENVQKLLKNPQKKSTQFENFPGNVDTFKAIQTLSTQSGNFPGNLDTFQTIRTLSTQSGNFTGNLETFQAIRILFSQFVKFPDNLENFQAIRTFSRQSRNFPDNPEIFSDNPETFQTIWKPSI